MREVRLIGTWKSDAKRTMEGWVFRPKTPPARRRAIAGMFGKLTMTFTGSTVVTEYNGRVESSHYRVLGKDSNSVAILSWDDNGPRAGDIQHIHFDESHFWVLIGKGPNIEWFRRIAKSSNSRLQRTARGGAPLNLRVRRI